MEVCNWFDNINKIAIKAIHSVYHAHNLIDYAGKNSLSLSIIVFSTPTLQVFKSKSVIFHDVGYFSYIGFYYGI